MRRENVPWLKRRKRGLRRLWSSSLPRSHSLVQFLPETSLHRLRHRQGGYQQDPAMPQLPRITRSQSGRPSDIRVHANMGPTIQAGGPVVPRETPWKRSETENPSTGVLILSDVQRLANDPPERFLVKPARSRDSRRFLQSIHPRATDPANP